MPKPLTSATEAEADAIRAYLSADLHRYLDPDTGEQRTRTRAAIAKDLRIRKAVVCAAMRDLDQQVSADAT